MRPRDNPFAVDRLHGLGFRGQAPAALWKLALVRKRGALIGAEGAGKTTLLLEIADHVRALGLRPVWIQLRRDERVLSAEQRDALASLTGRDVVFVDGADLLPVLDRWWLSRRVHKATALLGTLHAPGWLPTLAKLTTSAALLDDLVCELTGHPLAALPIDRDAFYARHRGNLRAALRDLYDRVAA